MKIITRTTRHLRADEEEFPLHFTPSEGCDLMVAVEGDRAVVSYLTDDYDYGDYEWPEGAEFILFANSAERDAWVGENLETCAECGEPRERHADDVRAEFTADGYVPPCDEFRPVFEWDERTFWVERYEHGLVRYALTGQSSSIDRQWDVASGVAVLKLDSEWGGDDPAAVAASLLEEYTDWCNGDIYAVTTQTYRRNEAGEWEDQNGPEGVCGFIGRDYATSEVYAAIRWATREFTNPYK